MSLNSFPNVVLKGSHILSSTYLKKKPVIYFLGFTVLVVLPTIPKKVASVGSKNPNHKKNTCCLLTGFFQVKPVKIALREYKKPEMVMKTERAFLREKCPLRLCLAVYGWIIVGCVWKEKSWWWKQEKARRKRVVSQWYTSPSIHISDIDLGIRTLSRKTSTIFLQLLAMLLQLLFHTFEKRALLYSGAFSKYFIVFPIDGQMFLQSIFGCQLQYCDFFY